MVVIVFDVSDYKTVLFPVNFPNLPEQQYTCTPKQLNHEKTFYAL